MGKKRKEVESSDSFEDDDLVAADPDSDLDESSRYILTIYLTLTLSEDEEDLRRWGSKKTAFVGQGEYDSGDEDAAHEEEAEMKTLQAQRAAILDTGDFGDLPVKSAQKAGKAKGKGKSKEAVERVSKSLAALSKDEKLDYLMNDSPELFDLLEQFKEKAVELKEKLQPLMEKVESGQLPTSKGISFLELKYQLLLSYCTNIAFYLLLKCNGKAVRDHPGSGLLSKTPVIDQLVKLRTILEKIKPIEQKLKYQIDKALRAASVGVVTSQGKDPLHARANLKNFVEPGRFFISLIADDAEAADSQGVYRPPKVAAAYFEERHEKEARKTATKKAKAASAPLMEYLR